MRQYYVTRKDGEIVELSLEEQFPGQETTREDNPEVRRFRINTDVSSGPLPYWFDLIVEELDRVSPGAKDRILAKRKRAARAEGRRSGS